MQTVTINQKKYEVPELTFKHLPQMEKAGLPMKDLISGDYIFTTLQVFVALVANVDTAEADRLIEQHIMGGGDIMPIFDAFKEALNKSAFFTKLLDRLETETK